MHAWLIPALVARPNKHNQQVLEQFAPPGTKHRWLNNPQDDPSLVFCLKMDTGYAAASDIFNAPFGVRLPNAILGKPFFGEFEYLVRFCACLHRRPCPAPVLPLCRRCCRQSSCSSHLPPFPSRSHPHTRRATARSPSSCTRPAPTRAARTSRSRAPHSRPRTAPSPARSTRQRE